MKSVGFQIKYNKSSFTVLELLREYIWGTRRGQFGDNQRKMLLKLYRRLERQEIKLEKTIYNMEYEIHKLEQDVLLNRQNASNYLRLI